MRRLGTIIFLAVWLAGFARSYAGPVCDACRQNAARSQALPFPVLTPDRMPCRFEGRWLITLCLEVRCDRLGHTWIRYENCDTGEVHTVGRYAKGYGGTRGLVTGQYVVPPAPISGVIYDLDLRREADLRAGKYYTISTVATNPIVFRGRGGGFGYHAAWNNCNAHTRDAWYHFTGEWYDLGCMFHTSNELLREIARRHPGILNTACR